MKASITYYPNFAKKSKRTGKIPLYARIILNAEKSESRLNADISENDIPNWDEMTMRLKDRTHYANHILNNLDQKFQQFLILHSLRLNRFTAKSIRNKLLGQDDRHNSDLINYVDQYFQKCVVSNREKSAGTVRNYRKAINHLKIFVHYKNHHHMQITDLNNKWVNEFKDFLVTDHPELNRKGMAEVSASGNIKKFRTIFDRAVLDDLLDKNPFKTIRLKIHSPQRPRLSVNEVYVLHNLDLLHFPLQSVYRDIFMFSIYTGLAYHDAIELQVSGLSERSDGETKLTVSRVKSGVLTESFLVSYARTIIDRFKKNEECQLSGSALPKRSNKELNLQLKLLANLAGIQLTLTSHIARHTFRQLLAEAGVEDIGVIKRMMGQSRGGDIDEVYYVITEARLLANKNKFENYLRNHFENKFCISPTRIPNE